MTDDSDTSETDDGYEEEVKDSTQKSQTRGNKVSTRKACSRSQEQQGKQVGEKRNDYKDKARKEQTERRRTKH